MFIATKREGNPLSSVGAKCERAWGTIALLQSTLAQKQQGL